MSKNKTPNLTLHSWDATDQVKRTEFNENFDKIDDKVGNLSQNKADKPDLAVKADKTYVDTQLTAKTDKTYVDTQIQSVASGSPKGTYATLTDLQTAFPTGNNNIYLVTADGKWYYWNGSAWTAGGTYQSTGIAERSVTHNELAFPAVEGKPRINLFNKDAVTKGSYVDRANGNIVANVDYSYCDYTEIIPSANYICNANDSGEQLAFYDSNKGYISGLSLTSASFTSPANAKYVRITVRITDIAGFMFVKGTTLPATYQPFIKPTTLNFDDSLSELEGAILNSGFSENFKRERINLYNKPAATTGYYVERSNGTLVANASYSSSDYIEIVPSVNYVTNMSDSGEQLAFYDSAKNYISGLLKPTSFVTPSNAKYVRMGVHINNVNKFMLVEGTALPANYVPYYSLVLENVLINSVANSVGKTVITVAKSGGDYSTVQSAIDNAQDSIDNPVTIVIYPGTYTEKVYVGPTRYISLLGLNKLTTIIVDHDGIHGNDPLRFEGTGICKNIQVISTGNNVTDLTTSFAYALHIDNVNGLGADQYYEDCIFRSHTSAAVGIGVQQDQEIKFKNCEMYSTTIAAAGASRDGAFYAHSSNRASNVTGQSVILDGCYLQSVQPVTLHIQDLGSGSEEMKVTFINNTLYSETNGTTDIVSTDALTTGNFSGVINLTPISHGNNIAKLNA